MGRPVGGMTEAGLDAELANFEAFRTSVDPKKRALFAGAGARYAELRLERDRRGGFDLAATLALVAKAARARRFLSYDAVAKANGHVWSMAVFRRMPAHLWHLIVHGHDAGLPVLSAIIVNKPNVGTGAMDAATLDGFAAAAESLGYAVGDKAGFLRAQQEAVFAHYADPPEGAPRMA